MKIAWMYPDTLFLHGERGNVLALERFAKELGADPVVDKVDFETNDFDPAAYDVLFFGAGEITSFESIVKDMERYKDALKAFIEAGKPVIATGTTMAMFGRKVNRSDGSTVECAGFIPVEATEREYVYGDDLYIEADYHGKRMEIVGNQIQMINIDFSEADAAAELGSGEKGGFTGFGKVVYGMGNNGKDGIEGVMYKNSVFTSLLGPALICNPWFTSEILRAAAEVSGEKLTEQDPSFDLEFKSLEKKKAFIAGKKPGSMGQ
jgi:CobQ-like glutamine amidotransferase family enzyme